MDYPISDVTRRIVYSGSAGTGPYSFSFEILEQTDIAVYKNTTLLTLTTDYTVTINVDGTGSVTLLSAATSADQITVVGDRGIARATDFVTGGDLFAGSLNEEFDSLVIFTQQVDEKADRAIKAPVTDPTDINMELPVKAVRKGTVLAFNETTGDPQAGPSIADTQSVADSIADITTVADNISDVNTVAGISGNVTTVADNDANVTTVATNIASVNTNAANIVAIQNAYSYASSASSSAVSASVSASAAAASAAAAAASFDAFDDIYLGAKSSDPSTDNDGDPLTVGDQYFNTTSNELRVWNGTSWQATSISGGTVDALAVNTSASLNYGTVNGVTYLNGSKALTSGNGLTFDGANFAVADANSYTVTRTVTDVNITGTNGSIAGSVYAQISGGYTKFFLSISSITGTSTWNLTGGYVTGLYEVFQETSNFGVSPTPIEITLGTQQIAQGGIDYNVLAGYSLIIDEVYSTSTTVFSVDSAAGNVDIAGTAAISGAVTLSGGTANGVAYLNGSKALTSGSALTFDGTNLGVGGSLNTSAGRVALTLNAATDTILSFGRGGTSVGFILHDAGGQTFYNGENTYQRFYINASEQMRLTSTGLGIGTSSPAGNLQVKASNPDVYITSDDTGQSDIFFGGVSNPTRGNIKYSDNSNFMAFNTAGSERLRIDSSGNLGLGVTPSAWGSFLKAFQISSGSLSVAPTDANLQLTNNGYFDGTNWLYQRTDFSAKYDQVNGAHGWYTAPSGTAGTAISFTQAMTLDASGNWMAGTTTAIGRATVVGGSSQLAFHDGNGGSTNYGLLNYGGSSGELTLNANSSGGNTLIRFLTSNGGSNAERARIDSSGNLGLGVTPSAWASGDTIVQIKAGTSSGQLWGRNGTLRIGANFYFDGTNYKYANSSYAPMNYEINSGSFTWNYAPVGTAGNNFSFSEAMRINSSGNVGIGTSSPATRLSVDNTRSDTAGTGWFTYTNSAVTSGKRGMRVDTNNGYWFDYYNGSSWSAQMGLDSSGNVGIGTSSPGYKLHVSGDIYATGNITAYSDIKLKTNIRTVENAVGIVRKMRGVFYDRIDTGEASVGVIAQEIQKVLPEVVSEKEGAIGVSYGNIVGVLIEAIKEQSEQIATLQAEVKALKGE